MLSGRGGEVNLPQQRSGPCPLVFLSTRRQLIAFCPLRQVAFYWNLFMLLFARRREPTACIYHFGQAEEGLEMIIERMKINCSGAFRYA
jgi:hypothetical protein